MLGLVSRLFNGSYTIGTRGYQMSRERETGLVWVQLHWAWLVDFWLPMLRLFHFKQETKLSTVFSRPPVKLVLLLLRPSLAWFCSSPLRGFPATHLLPSFPTANPVTIVLVRGKGTGRSPRKLISQEQPAIRLWSTSSRGTRFLGSESWQMRMTTRCKS